MPGLQGKAWTSHATVGRIRQPCLGVVPRVRTQLAIQLPDPDLLQRLKAAAGARGRTVTSLASEWLEAGLTGRIADPAQQALAQRVAALEAAVAALEARQPSRSARSKPQPLKPASVSSTGSTATTGAIETTELARRLGTNRKALTARIIRRGGARVGLELEGWRIVGKAPGPESSPWLWEPIA